MCGYVSEYRACGDGSQIIPQKDTPKIEVTMEPDEESNYTPEEKATYSKIKEYVKESMV